MPDHYDRLENRSPPARENILFRDLRHILAISKPRAPALRAQLRGVDVAKLTSRAELRRIPIIRRTDLLAAQADLPPLGGMNATRLGGLKRTFVSPSGLVSIAGQARDWWGTARALYAAGLRKGMLALNCFHHDLIADGQMIEAGLAEVGANVVSAGSAGLDRKVDVIARLRPAFFCGRTEELKAILDRAGDRNVSTSCLTHALVAGTSSKGLRSEYGMRKVNVRHIFMTPELGAIAFECGATDGMTINEGLIVEIIDPTTGEPTDPGRRGELVVTRINPDMPLVRFATGVWSAEAHGPSTCGRSNMRIEVTHERTPDSIDMGGRRIHISDVIELTKLFPTIRRASLVTRRQLDADELHLRIESGEEEPALAKQVLEKFCLVTSLQGTVEVLAPGTLSDEDATIIDERHLN